MPTDTSHLGESARRAGDIFWVNPDEVDIYTDKSHLLFRDTAIEPPPEWLVLSLGATGSKVPLILRRDGKRSGVVDGRKRLLAGREWNRRARLAGEPTIKLKAMLESGKTDRELAGLAELLNSLREQRDENPMRRARDLQRLKDLGYSVEELEAFTGQKAQRIREIMSLLDTAPEVQAKVAAGAFAADAAIEMTRRRLSQTEQVATLGAAEAAGATKGKAARAAVRATANGTEVRNKVKTRRPADLAAWLEELEKSAGPEVRVARGVLRVVLCAAYDSEALSNLPALREAAQRAFDGAKKRKKGGKT